MPTHLSDDKNDLFKLIADDSYIIDELGFERPQIKRTMNTNERIVQGKKQMFIYASKPERTKSSMVSHIVYRIDCLVPISNYDIADKALEYIAGKVQNMRTRHNDNIHILDPPHELASNNVFYINSLVLGVYETLIYN